ncbi:MAG TPA: dTDP-4-dehydrorhamnose 3,5-epimerase family protein [Chlamydiales bacterium]|nr:dTDP-4-dehydrorhamnose 3,5-epimerase family protein [Chlamydiales bacterium]
MIITPLKIKGSFVIESMLHRDDRGYLFEAQTTSMHQKLKIPPFVQSNVSYSKKDVIRGMHWQQDQYKLVRCLSGKIIDVIVDMRKGSPTYKMWDKIVLDSKEAKALLVPPLCAHGFCALEDSLVFYQMTQSYDPEKERGFDPMDPDIQLMWPVKNPILSEKDLRSVSFAKSLL